MFNQLLTEEANIFTKLLLTLTMVKILGKKADSTNVLPTYKTLFIK
jgi:hypothetical protein